jgi:serine protease Do
MASELDREFAVLAERLAASTVRVHDAGGRGSGSGVVWNRSGLVLTNAHVVRGQYATLETARGTRARAKLLGRDRELDLAALLVEPSVLGLEPAELRDAATLRAGELVVAVGNPLGLVGALTVGLVQRCNPRWVIADVRLAPGNSGGPLADVAGRVVGINSMIARGMALAVPTGAIADFLRTLGSGSAVHAA